MYFIPISSGLTIFELKARIIGIGRNNAQPTMDAAQTEKHQSRLQIVADQSKRPTGLTLPNIIVTNSSEQFQHKIVSTKAFIFLFQ